MLLLNLAHAFFRVVIFLIFHYHFFPDVILIFIKNNLNLCYLYLCIIYDLTRSIYIHVKQISNKFTLNYQL